MGVLIGLFTRSRLHAVSSAYRTSLEVLGRRAEEIFQSEQQLRTTLASIGDGVITCDADGHIQMMNPVACELTGWPQAEAAGRPLEEIFRIVNEDTDEPLETPVAKVKRLRAVVGLDNHTALLRKDGTRILIADSGAPIRDQTGEIVRHRPGLPRHHARAPHPGDPACQREAGRRRPSRGDDRA